MPTISIAPAAVFAMARVVSGYSGPLFRLRRLSDAVEIDVSAASGSQLPNYATIDTWMGSDAWAYVTTRYDQTGGGNHQTQATVANMPRFGKNYNSGGCRPLFFDNDSGVRYLTTPLISGFTNAFGFWSVIEPRVSYASRYLWQMMRTGGAANALAALIYENATSIGGYAGVVLASGFRPGYRFRNRVQSVAEWTRVNGDTTRQIVLFAAGNKFYATNGLTNQALDISITGGGVVPSTAATHDDYVSVAFNDQPSETDISALDTWAQQLFAYDNTDRTNRLVYGGSSLIDPVAAVAGFSTYRAMNFSATYDTINVAKSGRALSAEYAAYSGLFAPLYDASKRCVLIMDAPSNDLSAATIADQAAAEAWADNLYTTTTLPFVSAALATGFKVVVPTIIARGAFSTGNFKEYGRLRYQLNVVSGAAANGYTASDRAANAIFDTPADTANAAYYQADGTHPTELGATIMAGIDKAAVLAA